MHKDHRINYFLDLSRRPQSHPLFDDVQTVQATLTPEDYAQIAPYIDSNGGDVAAMARLLEDLLERYPLIPYLAVRVADMRFSLSSHATALDLYKSILDGPAQDIPEYQRWFATSLTEAVAKAERNSRMAFHKSPARGGQRWRSARTAQLPGSHLSTPRSMFQRLKARWNDMNTSGMLQKYCRYHTLCTNIIENTFILTSSAIPRIANSDYTSLTEDDIEGGDARDVGTVLKILHETDQALQDIITIAHSDPVCITPEVIRQIHRTLMKTQHILPKEEGGYSYTNIGVTRSVSKRTVALQTKGGAHVQFCPFWSIDEELENICKAFTRALTEGLDPFAVAAWITDVFVSLHPFDDGNGRLSRFLSSIPLLRAGLPLVNIPIHKRSAYHQHLNAVRGLYDGDYRPLMDLLYGTMNESLAIIETL